MQLGVGLVGWPSVDMEFVGRHVSSRTKDKGMVVVLSLGTYPRL